MNDQQDAGRIGHWTEQPDPQQLEQLAQDAAHRSDVAAIETIAQHTPQPDGHGGKVLRRPPLTYSIPSGVPWADQIRSIVRDYVDPDQLEDVTAEVAAWFVAAGNVRWRQGYAAGAAGEDPTT